jgi:hypothetical protein
MYEITQIIIFLSLFTALGFSVHRAAASQYDHRYDVGDHVPFFVNKVGPLNNPSETYQYYDLPFCHPDKVVYKKESFGEILNGDRLANSLFDLKFRVEKIGEILCQKKLKKYEVKKFRNAVISDFYFQMLYDDLPLWGYIGKIEDETWNPNGKVTKYYLFKHVEFNVLYNKNQVIEIRAFSDPNQVVDISKDVEVDFSFSYSLFWNETSLGFDKRMDKYSRASLLPAQRKIHWFSFMNSIVIIALLIGLLLVLFMQNLENDMRK